MATCKWCGKQITGKVYHYDTEAGSRLPFHRNCREYYIASLRKKPKFKKARKTGEPEFKFKKAVKHEEPKKFGTKGKNSDTSVGKLLKKIRGL